VNYMLNICKEKEKFQTCYFLPQGDLAKRVSAPPPPVTNFF